MTVTTEVVRLRSVSRTYGHGAREVHALRDVGVDVDAGQLLAVHGRSGSGKTTLLNIIGGLDRADEGDVHVCGRDLATSTDSDLTVLRRTDVAFVFQAFGLLPVLTAAENVEVPLRLADTPVAERRAIVDELLTEVGLGERARHRPTELSGGEQQRVAIARALASSPKLLIADEPTGQLDSRTGTAIMALIRRIVDERGLAAVIATHDRAVIDSAERHLELSDGSVVAAV